MSSSAVDVSSRQPFGEGHGLRSSTLFDGLLAHAGTQPLALAVRSSKGALSFAELLRRSSRLASHLNEKGVGPSDNVLLIGDNLPSTVIAVYAVMMAGATYIPVAKSTSLDRIHQINRQAATTTVLGDEDDLIAKAWSSPVNWALNYHSYLQDLPEDAVFIEPTYPVEPSGPAYISFAQSHDGPPRGTVISHEAATSAMLDLRDRFHIQPSDSILTLNDLGSAPSIFDLFIPAVSGCAIILPTTSMVIDAECCLKTASLEGATIWHTVAEAMELALQHASGPTGAGTLPGSLRLWVASQAPSSNFLPKRLTEAAPGSAFVTLGDAFVTLTGQAPD